MLCRVIKLECHMGDDVSHHLGAPWYCNHITVVPFLPSVVYRNCKQRGICDLVFWIRDTALWTLKKLFFFSKKKSTSTCQWGSVAGSMAAPQLRKAGGPVVQCAHAVDTSESISYLSGLSRRHAVSGSLTKKRLSHFSVSVSREESIVSSIACTNKSTTLDNTAKKVKWHIKIK